MTVAVEGWYVIPYSGAAAQRHRAHNSTVRQRVTPTAIPLEEGKPKPASEGAPVVR